MGRIVGDCPFCFAKQVIINEEHVFADWTIRALRAIRGPRAKFDMRHQYGQQTRRHTTRDPEITVYGPCKDICNNGWMKTLEDRVHPFLKDMITHGALTFLTPERAVPLALWTIKNAMNYEFVDPPPRPHYFTNADRNMLRHGHAPNHKIYVDIGRYSGPRPYSIAPLPMDVTLSTGDRFRARCVTMIAGQVVLQMVATPAGVSGTFKELTAKPGPWHRLIRLFPYNATQPPVWPPVELFNDDELPDLETRFLGPGVTMQRKPRFGDGLF